jgi:hypothetical protein
MVLILLAAAAWSIALGARGAFALSRRSTMLTNLDDAAEWVSALSLMIAGVWAWQTKSWLALLAGYALGWALLWLLPLRTGSPVARSARR